MLLLRLDLHVALNSSSIMSLLAHIRLPGTGGLDLSSP